MEEKKKARIVAQVKCGKGKNRHKLFYLTFSIFPAYTAYYPSCSVGDTRGRCRQFYDKPIYFHVTADLTQPLLAAGHGISRRSAQPRRNKRFREFGAPR